jgi:cytochrome c55X
MHNPGALLASLIFLIVPNLAAAEQLVDAQRQAELIHLLKHDCGSCHGMTMKGGLGPPLLPDTMAAWPPDALRNVILNGVPETAMPGWRGELTEGEADFLARVLQQGIPDDK